MHVQARMWSKWIENWNDSSISGWNRGRYSTSNDVLMQWTQSLVNFPYTVTFEPHCRNSVKHSPFVLLLSVISLSLCPGSHCPLLVTECLSPHHSLCLSAPWTVYQTPAQSSHLHFLHQNLLPLHCHHFLLFLMFLQ